MRKIYTQFHGNHSLLKMIEHCLHNGPQKRPKIREVLHLVEKARDEMGDEECERNKLELIQALHNQSGKQNLEHALQEVVIENNQLQQQLINKEVELSRAEETIRRQQQQIDNMLFCEDHAFLVPASTTSGLYEQLGTKCYQEISRKEISVQGEIVSGHFSTVSKGLWTYNRECKEVLVKALTSKASEKDRVRFLQEAAIMGQFFHPYIVQLHGVVTVGEPRLIVIEFMSNGDMKSYLDHLVIRKEDQARLPSLFLGYCRQIASGMVYLAAKSFVHRDLAARNIFLDEHMCCKVGGFGMARDLMDGTYYKSASTKGKIPIKWTAPEALLYKKYSIASDVWSYAMILYEIWSVGKKPFQELSNRDVVSRLQTYQCLNPPSGCPREIYTIMVHCWHPDPHNRPTFRKVISLLWQSDGHLLRWSEEDVAARKHLLRAVDVIHSFSDLQNMYITHKE